MFKLSDKITEFLVKGNKLGAELLVDWNGISDEKREECSIKELTFAAICAVAFPNTSEGEEISIALSRRAQNYRDMEFIDAVRRLTLEPKSLDWISYVKDLEELLEEY